MHCSLGVEVRLSAISVNISSQVSLPPQVQSQELDHEAQDQEETREIEPERIGEEGRERIYRLSIRDSV